MLQSLSRWRLPIAIMPTVVIGVQVQVAKQLLERNKKGLPIHSVPIAIA